MWDNKPPALVSVCVCVSGSLTPRIKQEWESLKDETSHLTLNVFKQMLMALEEIEVLEFSVISLGLHQPTLLNIHHLPEAVWERSERLTQTLFQAEASVIALGCLSAQNDTYTCWAGVQSLPCYCVWSIGQNLFGKSALVKTWKLVPV